MWSKLTPLNGLEVSFMLEVCVFHSVLVTLVLAFVAKLPASRAKGLEAVWRVSGKNVQMKTAWQGQVQRSGCYDGFLSIWEILYNIVQ